MWSEGHSTVSSFLNNYRWPQGVPGLVSHTEEASGLQHQYLPIPDLAHGCFYEFEVPFVGVLIISTWGFWPLIFGNPEAEFMIGRQDLDLSKPLPAKSCQALRVPLQHVFPGVQNPSARGSPTRAKIEPTARRASDKTYQKPVQLPSPEFQTMAHCIESPHLGPGI